MVSILPSARTPFDVIGADVGQALQNVLPQAVQQGFQRGQLQNSLESISNLSQNPQTKPLDLILAAMKAGAGIPGSERYLGALIPEIAKFAQANASQNIPLAGEQQIRDRTDIPQISPRGQAPTFLNQPEQTAQFFPTNLGPQGGPGNLPRPATTGEIRQIPNRSEMIDQARDLSQKSTAAGIPLTVPQALEQVKSQVEEDKVFNDLVERETRGRVQKGAA